LDHSPLRRNLILAALCLWLLLWSLFAWHAVQDDAFIHLRYAANLQRLHFITYDGIHPDFGTSSLLYVALLAALRTLTTSADLPHLLSLLQHVALFAALALLFDRLLPRAARAARALALLTLVLVVTPSAVRWFQDGMETGLTALFSVLLAATVWRFTRLQTFRATHYATLFALGAVLVIHRVELVLPVILAFLLLALGRPHPTPRRFLDASPLLAGAALSVTFIFATMHALLPDTALAKSGAGPDFPAAFHSAATVLTGAMSIGAGLALFWVITLAILVRRRPPALPTLLANAIFPLTFLLAGLRGQEIQGARYLLWTFLFSIAWNILELGSLYARPAHSSKTLIYAFTALLAVGLPFESYFMHHVLVARAATWRIFQAQHLHQISGLQGAAYDVGYIGYFSQAPICDLAGLVNGRAVARLSKVARSQRCAAIAPAFVFGNWDQVSYFALFHPLHGWHVCGHYDYVNVRGLEEHFLIASPQATAQVCAAGGGAEPTPTSLLPFLAPTPNP
jgi:hypothetical protein